MFKILSLLAIGAVAIAAEHTILIGKTLDGWRKPQGQWQVVREVQIDAADPKKLMISSGEGRILVNGNKPTSNLISEVEHGDVEAHIEFMVPKNSNSGVYFQGRYEIQVYDSFGVKEPKHSDCGGIYERWKNDKGFEGHAPKVNASKAPGEWQSFDVVFRAPRFDASGKKVKHAAFLKVVHNGQLIHENVELTGPTRAATYENDEKPLGPLMLQGDHGPVAYRNILLRPVKLN